MSTEAERHCSNVELATGWALHALEPDDEAGFARHLPHCAECAAEVKATEDMAVLLGADVKQYEPPAHLRAAVLNAARSPQVPRQNQPVGMAPRQLEPTPVRLHTSKRRPLSHQHARRGQSPRKVLVAAAAVVVLGFGAVVGWAGSAVFTDQGTSSVSALDEQDVLSALTDPSVRKVALTDQGSSTPMALLLAGPTQSTVLPVNMPSAPSNSEYVLWGVPAGANVNPVPLGSVTGANDAHGTRSVVPMGATVAASFNTFAVSVEPAGTVPTTPTKIVATGQARA